MWLTVIALILGVILRDWPTVNVALRQNNQCLPEKVLVKVANHASFCGALFTAVAALKLCRPTYSSLKSLSKSSWEMLNSCPKVELGPALALAVSCYRLFDPHVSLSHVELRSLESHIRKELPLCSHPGVVGYAIGSASLNDNWEWVIELMPYSYSCDQEALFVVLSDAITNGHPKIAMNLIDWVDVSRIDWEKDPYERTILGEAITYNSPQDMLQLVIAAGVSTVQRDEYSKEEKAKSERQRKNPERLEGSLSCPLVKTLCKHDLSTISLLLESGAVPNSRLFQICCFTNIAPGYVVRMRDNSDDEIKLKCQEWWKGYKMIANAASNPPSLRHLARLTVSHDVVGFAPGRNSRIDRLPLPNPIKALVKFRDVLTSVQKEDSGTNLEDFRNDICWSVPMFSSTDPDNDFLCDMAWTDSDSD